ncbi:unnamed protein product [Lupinus luteus]|uniref:Reverse transcriptase Ty1/copia-type domain-containing protein n=1 Tax=Lupinus luteus TaxID=3873 RepID=A0AAV1WCJ7_LUPLU
MQLGFTKCTTEHGVYVKGNHIAEILIICLYVDDLLITSGEVKNIQAFKEEMQAEFEMSDLGELSYFLGMEFRRTNRGILMHQTKYATDVLKRFQMMNCNTVATPIEVGIGLSQGDADCAVDKTLYRQMIGSLRYVCNSRPDLAYGVGLVSRYMESPKQSHMSAVKRIFRYLKGTLGHGIMYPTNRNRGCNESSLIAFSDADWCGDKTDRKSTTGYFFLFNNALISWCSKKQDVVALSTCESEYIAASLNPVAHGRSKHIETRFHYIREQVSKWKVKVEHCKSENQLADLFTKPLKRDRFEKLRHSIGVENGS